MQAGLVIFYCVMFLLPSVGLKILQYKHITRKSKQKPVLLTPENYLQSANYAKSKLRLGMIQNLFSAGLFIFWLVWGLGFLHAYTPRFFVWDTTDYVFIVLLFLILSQFLFLPFRYYVEMVIDKQYGLSQQSHSVFFLDFVKSLLLILLLGGVVVYGLVFLMEGLRFWWLWSALFVFAVIVLINFVYPTLIAPLFNIFTPLEDEVLKDRVATLLKSVGFESQGVFIMDASKRDGRLNAYFGGLGKNKRVVLFDTLIDKISTEGIMAILGHELGHFKAHDVITNIVLQGIFLFFVFFMIAIGADWIFSGLHFERNPGNLLVLLILLAPIAFFWFLPVVGYFSRKAEFRADAFGASLVSKKALSEALIRLVNENKSFPSSHPWYIFFHYTHPPLLERLKALDYEL